MAGVFASLSIRKALDKLASFLPTSLASRMAPRAIGSPITNQDLEDLRKLERTMRRIHATLQDAEQHWNIREESAKLRLEELKELAYDAEDVVEEYEYEVNRSKVEVLQRCANNASKRRRVEENDTYSNDNGMVAVPNELAVQVRKIIKRFDEIKEYSDNFTLSKNDGERLLVPDITSLRKTTSFVYVKAILGREVNKNEIVEKIVSIECKNPCSSVCVVAIVGMGGLGKTTLAQLVYNDPRVCRYFDTRAWVCVSERFEVSSITKNIITSVTKEGCDVSELDDLQTKLVEKIKEKKVLLVLDDVWNERRDCWELLRLPMSTTNICKIIVTTRSEAVSRLVQTMPFYRIDFLNSDESWILFKQVVFDSAQENNIPPNLLDIGKSIVEKCKGLPLAIKTLGSMLRYTTDEMRWRYVLESELWDLEQSGNDVLPALELSYKYMPKYLKACFVALSLYPKDYYIERYEVIKLWILLDLVQFDGSENLDEIGSLYFDELVQRSFLQVDIRGDHNMHDLIHDLACFLGAKEFLRIEGDAYIKIPQSARYISINGDGASFEAWSPLNSVRAIVMLPAAKNRTRDVQNLLSNCMKLRTLIGRSLDIESLPDLLNGMRLLRHLSIKDSADRETTEDFHMPPLFNLRTLKWYFSCGNFVIRRMHGIGCLINLRSLPAIHIKVSGLVCNISELRTMNKIRELSIGGMRSASIEDTNQAQISSKKDLRILQLDFDAHPILCYRYKKTMQGVGTHEQLLENLRPHHGLRELKICGYESQKYPSWVGNTSFSKLTEIKLSGCKSQQLPVLGELPFLKSLYVRSMYYVKCIGREFCSYVPGVKGFPSLTHLEFHNMPALSEWSADVGDFPRLHNLAITNADELKYLPTLPSLLNLKIQDCPNLTTVDCLTYSENELV